MNWFRAPQIKEVAARSVMLVCEEPLHSIYRYDLLIPDWMEHAEELMLISGAYVVLAEEMRTGTTYYREGEEFRFMGNPEQHNGEWRRPL